MWPLVDLKVRFCKCTYVKWKENSFNISQIFTIFSTIGQWFQIVNWKCFLVIFFNGVCLIWVFILDIFISFYLHCLTLSHKNHTCIMKGNNTVNSKVIIRIRLTLLTLHIFIFFTLEQNKTEECPTWAKTILTTWQSFHLPFLRPPICRRLPTCARLVRCTRSMRCTNTRKQQQQQL